MPVLLGIDTGGTYTDAVLYSDARGVIASAKALTTKHDLSIGIRQALETILKPGHPEISLVSLSTTLATNALVEGQGSPICLLLLGYPPDALELAGLGKALGNDPVVFINGGHLISGDEQMPLDLDAVRRAILEHAPKAAAFAVSGYFSVHNPTHELAVRELIHQLSGLPVTCGHELTSHLHAPRRALTAALNARLIPFLQQLILSVKATLKEKGILAPLMVVKGDGSLVDAQVALERPVETILSGPAASVVGARHLSGEADVLVADMGGTTTDIALLEGGKPEQSKDGAIVGGWHTMVEAIAVHTSGLGGDSEVQPDEKEGLVVGPQRVVPLSLLAFQHPECLEKMRQQTFNSGLSPYSGRFVLRQRMLDMGEEELDSDEREVWDRLANGPLAVDTLLADKAKGLWWQRALNQLSRRGLVILSAFTPTDAAHVLGYQTTWSSEAARLGAELWIRRADRQRSVDEEKLNDFCQQVMHQVIVQLGRALLAAALSPEDEINLSRPSSMRRIFIDRALQDGRPDGLVDVRLTLKIPLVAVGAPVETYFPPVAERLHTRLVTPPHAEVANAVGAVVGSVVQTVRATIRKLPDEQGYRIHLPEGVEDFSELEEAAPFASQEVARLAEKQALRAGASNPQVQVRRHDQVYRREDNAGEEIYLGTEVTATAVGRPKMGRE
jgi:N-methylhydantoinase A/oxoprolinase/acetone carboxylase beta subunit